MSNIMNGDALVPKDLSNYQCIFCQRYVNHDKKYGEKLAAFHENGTKKDLVVTHYFCLLFSPAIFARLKTNEGIKGFSTQDILKEAKRGMKLKCCYCKRMGATAACCDEVCRVMYHPSCAIDAPPDKSIQFQFRGQFLSFCRKHRKVKKFLKTSDWTEYTPVSFPCVICKGEIDRKLVKTNPLELLQCKHCKTYCHRRCVRKYAMTVGEMEFKCRSCKCNITGFPSHGTQSQYDRLYQCKYSYLKHAQDKGVYVPKAEKLVKLADNLYFQRQERTPSSSSSRDSNCSDNDLQLYLKEEQVEVKEEPGSPMSSPLKSTHSAVAATDDTTETGNESVDYEADTASSIKEEPLSEPLKVSEDDAQPIVEDAAKEVSDEAILAAAAIPGPSAPTSVCNFKTHSLASSTPKRKLDEEVARREAFELKRARFPEFDQEDEDDGELCWGD